MEASKAFVVADDEEEVTDDEENSVAKEEVEEVVEPTFLDKLNEVNLPTWIFFVVIAIVLVIGIKFAKAKEWHEDFVSLDSSKALLGVCAVLVVLHHVSQALGTNAGA